MDRNDQRSLETKLKNNFKFERYKRKWPKFQKLNDVKVKVTDKVKIILTN